LHAAEISSTEISPLPCSPPKNSPDPSTFAKFPSPNGEELIHRDCVLAMVGVMTPTPTWSDGEAIEHAIEQQLAKSYGNSIGMKPALPCPELGL
jgi:hypothetical protein